MNKTKNSREIFLEKQKLRQQRRREKIKEDPELYAALKEKDRQKYYKRKREGKILPVNQETPARKNQIRTRNREHFRAYYRRQKEIKETIKAGSVTEIGPNDDPDDDRIEYEDTDPLASPSAQSTPGDNLQSLRENIDQTLIAPIPVKNESQVINNTTVKIESNEPTSLPSDPITPNSRPETSRRHASTRISSLSSDDFFCRDSLPKTKQSREEILEKQKLRQRQRRERIKEDPVLYAAYKERDRQKYYKRKREGKILPIDQETSTRKIQIRNRNREHFRAYYRRQKELKALESIKVSDIGPSSNLKSRTSSRRHATKPITGLSSSDSEDDKSEFLFLLRACLSPQFCPQLSSQTFKEIAETQCKKNCQSEP